MLNAADAMKTCKNMKKMIKAQAHHEIFIPVHSNLNYNQFVKAT